MRDILALALSLPLLSTALALPANAAPRKNKKAAAAAPPKGDRAALVAAGKMPAYFNPKDLSKVPVISGPSAILIDADTGQVLWEKNADVRRAPASTTKIMTGLLLVERTQPTDIITCMDPNITRIEESSLHIKPWEKFTSKDLMYGLMLRSANDGAVVIAQHLAGSVPAFAQMMNERARQCGATNTNFVNPNGLPSKEHYTTARDLSLIAREALKNPRFEDAVGTPKRVIVRSKLQSDTVITAKVKRYFYDKFPGADGVKTGYTRAARHCFVGSATRDGRRLLTVVLGAADSASGDTIPMMSWGFKRFPQVILARKNQLAGNMPAPAAQNGAISVVAADTLHATTDSLRPEKFQFAPELKPLPNLTLPVKKGQEVGTIAVLVNGAPVSEVKLLAAEDTEAAPLPVAAVRHTGGWLLGGMASAGGLGILLIAWRYATASAKSARRRRNRLTAARRGVNRSG